MAGTCAGTGAPAGRHGTEAVVLVASRDNWFVRLLKGVLRILWAGLVSYGAAYSGTVVPPGPPVLPRHLRPGPHGDHPERSAAHIPPSPVESRLWAQLD
ncbi:DUF6059 family protein [Micromonospora sp. DT47]|uniref:DUF6059 family protein n=1 Tax=Micromonospora sp. DT47 TaxID=3393431 RepID=UPI003CEB8366